jgi:uncharacterized protein YndB with AHSA1/START domain
MKNEICQTWFFRQSPAEVWAYLTQPELIAQWLTRTNFKPVAGHRFGWLKPTGYTTDCEVLEVRPVELLSYSWKVKPPNGSVTVDSIVTWTLSAKDGGTELLLVHDGFTALADLLAHENGWKTCLARIDELLQTA